MARLLAVFIHDAFSWTRVRDDQMGIKLHLYCSRVSSHVLSMPSTVLLTSAIEN